MAFSKILRLQILHISINIALVLDIIVFQVSQNLSSPALFVKLALPKNCNISVAPCEKTVDQSELNKKTPTNLNEIETK